MKQFTAQEFVSASPEERIRWCNAMAAEAAKLSAASENHPLQSVFRQWAKQMCAVADAIARELVLRADADAQLGKNRQASLPFVERTGARAAPNLASSNGSSRGWDRRKDQRRNRVLLFGD